MKPKLFIGSSVEGLIVAENIKVKLDFSFDVDLWSEGVFGIGNTTIDDLLAKLNESDFGIFVFSPDDKATIKNEQLSVVRDNVLYELGLYTGKLGRKNCFIIAPDNLIKDFHLPTDLIGINLGKYDASKINSNPESAVSVFCTKLKSQVFNPSKYTLGGKWKATWGRKGSSEYNKPETKEVEVFHYESTFKFILDVSKYERYLIKGEISRHFLTGSFNEVQNIGRYGAFQAALNGHANCFEGLYMGWKGSGEIDTGPFKLER
ncbi:MAG: nucleotide-binding protein [Parafilimonas sp.]|nr:nucleotide-binding protein [Parafilimonas sp.]